MTILSMNKKALEKLKTVAGINSVILFGSTAKGEQGNLSDVDLCIIGELNQNQKAEIYSQFGKEYDVSFFDELPVYIQMRVFQGKVLFCNDEDFLYGLCFSALKKYGEFKYLLNKRLVEDFGKCMI